MTKLNFEVSALWDSEAGVWYSESNIIGLHIEAATIEEFESVVREYAADLIVENHLNTSDWANTSLRDLIPTVFLRQGKPGLNAA